MEILFVCFLKLSPAVKKDIVIIPSGKGCRIAIEDAAFTEDVGGSNHHLTYCKKLADKVKADMARKGYQCDKK